MSVAHPSRPIPLHDRSVPIELQTDLIAVQVRPDEGGRISSLVCRHSGTEFLTQTRRSRPAIAAGMEARFQDGPCAGIEDCLPTVGACGEATEGGPAPDHGDFWQLPWTVGGRPDSCSIQMQTAGFSRPLLLRKDIGVQGPRLTIRYEVANTGTAPTSLLFALHPLLQISAGDRVCLPEEVREVNVTYARGLAVESLRGPVAWPRTSSTDLSFTGDITDGSAVMLYSDRLARGLCGLYRSSERQGLLLHFDTQQLPYLGVWLCYGGWPDPPSDAPQYAVALEPTTAPCNNLEEAQRARMATRLMPGALARWQVAFDVSPPGQSYSEFVRQFDGVHALVK